MAALAQLYLAKRDYPSAERYIADSLGVAPHDPEFLRLDGQILQAKGDLAGALARYTDALAAHPGYLAALLSRTQVYIAKNDWNSARADIAEAIKLAPNSIPTIYFDAYRTAHDGDLKDADVKLEKIVGNSSSFPTILYLAGTIKYMLGHYALADEYLTRYLARQPGSAHAIRMRAEIALKRGDFAAAINIIKPAVNRDSKDLAAASILAQAYVASGNRDKAVEIYEKAAAAEPNDVNAQTRLAMARLQAGETSQGISELEDIAHSENGAKTADPILVLANLRKGDIASAASTAEKLINLKPNDPVAQNLLAVVRVAQKQYVEAEKMYLGIIQKYPKFLEARHNLAQLYVLTNRASQAERVLRDSLGTQPRDVKALVALAKLAATNKDYDASAKWLEQAEQASPQDPTPGIQLVELYIFQKQWDKANGAASGLASRFSDNIPVLELQALALADSGSISQALASYQRLAARFPDSGSLFEHYALVQARNGDVAGARMSLEHASSVEPQSAPRYMTELVNLEYNKSGENAAIAAAQSFASQQPVLSALLTAGVYFRSKKIDQAIAELTSSQKQLRDPRILTELAQLTWRTGKHSEAIAMLEDWLKDHRDASDVRLALAMIYQAGSNDKAAEAQYELILKAAPNNVVALNNLAVIYSSQKDARALDLAQHAYRLAPRADVADTLGWIMVNNGNGKEALPYLREAGNGLPQNMVVQYHLAVGLSAAGDKKSALDVLERVINSKQTFDEKKDAQKLYSELKSG